MKIILSIVLICATLFCACVSEIQSITPVENITVLNFEPFVKNGILVTPDQYQGKYESCGLLFCTVVVGATKITVLQNNVATPNISSYYWRMTKIDVDTIFVKLVEQIKSLNGNAITHFKLSDASKTQFDAMLQESITLPGISIEGFIIKRLE